MKKYVIRKAMVGTLAFGMLLGGFAATVGANGNVKIVVGEAEQNKEWLDLKEMKEELDTEVDEVKNNNPKIIEKKDFIRAVRYMTILEKFIDENKDKTIDIDKKMYFYDNYDRASDMLYYLEFGRAAEIEDMGEHLKRIKEGNPTAITNEDYKKAEKFYKRFVEIAKLEGEITDNEADEFSKLKKDLRELISKKLYDLIQCQHSKENMKRVMGEIEKKASELNYMVKDDDNYKKVKELYPEIVKLAEKESEGKLVEKDTEQYEKVYRDIWINLETVREKLFKNEPFSDR